MTKQEKKIKRYVNAIERELRLPLKAKARINGDIGTDIHARLEKGQSIDEIIAEMGTPQEVAAGFNEEMQDQLLPKGSPWRWVFLIAAILAGGAALLSILPFLLFYFQSSGMGVIGGADGPTAIFITGAANLLAPVLTPLWLAVPFILGCCAACVLLRWGQNGPRAKHTLALMFSAAALLCWLLLGILSLWQAASAGGRRCIVLENAAVPAVQPDAASEFLASRGNAVHCSAPPENRVPEAITSNEDTENPSPAGDGFLYFSALRRPQAYLRLS